jgi:23S rRNA (adenine-N6)-dimethyltransferase
MINKQPFQKTVGRMPSRKKHLSQIFLKDNDLVTRLVKQSSINKNDTVLEIGPGKGIITNELIKRARKVIAVEKDPLLYKELVSKYKDCPTIDIYNTDILHFNLPTYPYKVFSNIPFALEGQIIRMLIDHPHNPPVDAYLVMRREVAERLAGVPKEGRFSILHKPWFELEIFHHFRREDFKPKPKVESSMLRFRKRKQPLIHESDKRLYELFIRQGFGGGRRIRQNLSLAFSFPQLKILSRNLGFKINNMPKDLTFEQWLKLFESTIHAPSNKKRSLN